jgi:hypothetical protein
MSPTGRENVVNKMLGGEEIKSILRADFEKLLEGESLLSHYIAYGRLSYDLTLRLHLDNPMRPESEVRIASKSNAAAPQVAPPPLSDPSKESVASGTNLHRDIKSPNEERLRHGLTLPVVTTGPDGTIQTEQVKYPPSPELGPGTIAITDITKETREAWQIPTLTE